MITLFSGNPRSGKTASMVDLLIDLSKERPIYVHSPAVRRAGVDPFHEHLKLPFTAVDANEWQDHVPDGAVLVIDEVQDLWRPRGPGAKPPLCITALETHGHRGIDIFVTSQKPRLIDQSVRDLVGRHVHIRDTGWLGRYSYEWPECSENLAWKTCVLKKRFKVPVRTFGVYKSANVHTKAPRGKSMMPAITVGLVLLTAGLVFGVYRAIAGKVADKPAVASAVPTPYDGPENVPAVGPKGRRGPEAAASAPSWPRMENEPVVLAREPYADRALQLEGEWIIGDNVHAVFGVIVNGQRVATASLVQLVRAGYSWKSLAPCSGSLRFGNVERLITCGAAVAVNTDPVRGEVPRVLQSPPP